MNFSLFIFWAVQLLLIPAAAPFMIGMTRKFKALMQGREGASIFQPYRDLYKLFNKDEVVSRDASWVFLVAPYIIFAVMLVVGASIPLISSAFPNMFTSDFLLVVYLLAVATFFLALAGVDTGGGFGGFGSSREMFVASLTEGGLLLSLLALALIARTTNLFGIAAHIQTLPFSHATPLLLTFMSFVISMLAETKRFPFDNPATHLELTMIHEAMILEYSGKRLGLIEWSAWAKYLIFIALGANLFFPAGLSLTLTLGAIIPSLVAFLLKAILFCFAIALLESTTAKFRIFRLPDLLFTSLIINVIAIALIV